MTDTTAKIRAKGLDSTGVTEEIAAQLYAHKGRHIMAIVELKVEERHEKSDGTRKVDLVIEQVEPAEHNGDLDKHLRELTRTCYANRAHADGQAAIDDQLDGGLTPALKDAIAAGGQHEPHPFLPTDAADDLTSCEVCGLGENANPHRAYIVNQQTDPFATPERPATVDTVDDDAEQGQPVLT